VPKYLISGSYSVEGTQGLLEEGGTSRKATVEQLVKGLGGSLESLYFGFGSDDVYVIIDAPDNVTMVAVSLAVAATGAVRLKTTVLITPEEMDQATKKTVPYRAPGA